MENDVILYGASGHCKVIIDILDCSNRSIKAIIDDNPKITTILEKGVFHSSKVAVQPYDSVILTIGNNKVRKKLANQIKASFTSAIHPKAMISNYSKISNGTVVMMGVIVNSDAVIGRHCIINSNAVVEHDCTIEDYVHISPNAALAGGVFVGEGSQVGIGAVVIQNVRIGKWCVIGAGAIIIKDVPDFAVVVGNPGKIIKYNFDHE
jgi:sugar O-acyltransferase (sialic acid O-acetyltransferase NeuD family)